MIYLALFFSFMAIRLAPIFPVRKRGCDAYNILLNAEYLRKTKKLPIKVPLLFMLEKQEQWYPPGFLILCALIPQKILKKYFWCLNHIIDFGSASIIYFSAIYFSVDIYISFFVALIYAFLAGLVLEFSSLNVRPLGLFLFNVVLLFSFFSAQNIDYLPVAIFLGILTFYSHKLSLQQAWFTLPVLTLVTGDWVYLFVLIGSYFGAFVIWPRGAYRVLRGHIIIIKFWHKNWKSLGAHLVKQSPIYGDGVTRNEYYSDDHLNTHILFIKGVIHQNYFAFVVGALVLIEGINTSFSVMTLILTWIISVYLWGFSIHFLKPLRGIGLGQQYFKFAIIPSLLGISIFLSTGVSIISWVIIIIAFLLAIRQYLLILKNNRQTKIDEDSKHISKNFEVMLDELRNDETARIMCLPVHLCDQVAYEIRKPVYWGTHSDVFDDRLEQLFPLLKHDISYYAKDGVNRILIDERYVTAKDLNLDTSGLVISYKPYSLYKIS